MIDEKEKEIVAIGISVAAGCKPCTDFHVRSAREKGASNEDINSAIELALSVRRRATQIIKEYSQIYLTDPGDVTPPLIETTEINRINVMLAIGAAFGVNCVSTLQEYLELAEETRISPDDITIIARLAKYVKKKAALHVERVCGVSDERGSNLKLMEASNG